MKNIFMVLSCMTYFIIVPNCSAQEGISKGNITSENQKITAGDSHFFLNKSSAPEYDMAYVILHDNENTAVEATREHIEKHGGVIYEIIAQGQREITFSLGGREYIFDPNRIYSQEGIPATLDNYNSSEWRTNVDAVIEAVSDVSKQILGRLNNHDTIIAVHNNTDGDFGIQNFRDISKGLYINPDRDSDNFYVVNSEKIYGYLALYGYNVALQVEPEDDGSLIVWACLTGRTYINVETQHGEKEKQKEMLNLADRLCLDEKITLFDYPKEGQQYLNLIEKYADTFSSDEKNWYVRLASQTIAESRQRDSYAILIDKLRRRLYLYNSGELAETYRVAFGRRPVERKIMQDNSSTPEGRYKVAWKNPKSSFYKAFYLNYPNAEDKHRFRNAKKERRIPEDATIGGDIEIHGEGISSDWTFGCIAMENEDIDKLWRIIRVGAPVTIVRYLPSGYIESQSD